jgi:hypothetical protein
MRVTSMKHKYLLVLVIAGILSSCSKEEIGPGQTDAFIKFFGSSGLDQGNDVKQTSDGGYILTGSVTRPTGDADIVLIRTNKYGNEEWKEYYGGPGDDAGNALQITGDGGYIVLCTLMDTLIHESDLYLLKITPDSKGTIQWEKRIIKPGNQVGSCIQLLSNGFIMSGTTNEAGTNDILLVRTTDTGDIQEDENSWYAYRGYGINDEGSYVIQNPTEPGFVVVGTTSLEDVGQSLTGTNVIVIAVTENGVGWANKIFGGTGADRGTCVKHILGSEFIITGTLDETQSSHMFAHRISIVAEQISSVWSQPIQYVETSKTSTGQSVCVLDDGTITLLGSMVVSTGNSDFYFVKTTADGTVLFYQTYGGAGNEYGISMEPASDGGFIMIGSTGIPEDNNRMIALVKTNNQGKLSAE